MVSYLKRYQIPQMTELVSSEIKESLDSQLENYILAKLDERIDLKIQSAMGQ
jgi:ribosomal protein L29